MLKEPGQGSPCPLQNRAALMEGEHRMTLEKIIVEMEKRLEILEKRERELKEKSRSFRFREPFRSLTDREIDHDREMYNALYRLQKPFDDKVRKIQSEKGKIRDLLWEYRKNS